MINSIIKFDINNDNRGNLIVLENYKNIPFNIKRVFYIFNVKNNISRGNHAHYKTKQLLIAVQGSCKVTLDSGKKKKTYFLNSPDKGLFQDSLIWGTMHNFSDDCILMVIANTEYDINDYINDYNIFLQEVKNDS